VTTLRLSYNELSGTIPTEMGAMKAIVSGGTIGDHNFLNFNDFSGTIPSELGAMTSFEEFFELRDLSVTRSIPTQLGNVSCATLIAEYPRPPSTTNPVVTQ